jgi:hypothetical protein
MTGYHGQVPVTDAELSQARTEAGYELDDRLEVLLESREMVDGTPSGRRRLGCSGERGSIPVENSAPTLPGEAWRGSRS